MTTTEVIFVFLGLSFIAVGCYFIYENGMS